MEDGMLTSTMDCCAPAGSYSDNIGLLDPESSSRLVPCQADGYTRSTLVEGWTIWPWRMSNLRLYTKNAEAASVRIPVAVYMLGRYVWRRPEQNIVRTLDRNRTAYVPTVRILILFRFSVWLVFRTIKNGEERCRRPLLPRTLMGKMVGEYSGHETMSMHVLLYVLDFALSSV